MATKKDNTKIKKTNKTKNKKSTTKKTNKKLLKKDNKDVILYEIKLICLIAATVLMILSFHTESVGLVGNYINSFFKGLFSNAAYVFPYLFFTVVFVSLNKNFKKYKFRYIIAFFLMLSAILLYITVPTFDKATEIFNINYFSFEGIKKSYQFGMAGTGGGIVGNILTYLLYYLIGKIGIYLTILVNFVISILLITNYSIKTGFKTIKKKTDNFAESYEKKKINNKINVSNRKINHLKTESMRGIKKGFRVSSAESGNLKNEVKKSEEKSQKETEDNLSLGIEIHDYVEKETEEKISEPIEETKEEPIKKNERDLKQKEEKKSAEKKEVKKIKDSDIDQETTEKIEKELEENSHIQFPDYVLPRINLLNKSEKRDKIDHAEYRRKADILFQTLKNFNVDGKIISITNGPSLTRYEFKPSPGIKVSKIKGLSDDIALKLAVPRVRIAPVPNKAAIGIEVPNKSTNLVNIRQVLSSKEFRSTDKKLNVVLGKSISGKTVIADLADMPHLLIAGATGSGKSVCVNTIVTSILYSATPDEVKFLMIDPKVVELSHYNGIPHLVLPVVTDPKKAAIALNWAVKEMEERYEKFAKTFTRDLQSYNVKFPEGKMSQIVVIIDELADLMMVAPKQVENSIARIAQKARAAGIHLIVATQRPSVDVITGVIKANIPSRISFAVSSAVDSRTILDEGGAEKLLGKGDMLYRPVGAPKPIRLQGAFISDGEVSRTTEFIKNQIDKEKINYKDEILDEPQVVDIDHETDEYLSQAIDIVVKSQKGSISLIQRKLRVGYNRAARMIDSMEERNIVGAANGSKPREVLVSKEDLEDIEV
ncbi:MAG TPA: DNA translocase FtsK [Clostridia bacterium]|nr:DNA translocase FtsK [Clostridia bacterium]